MIFKYKGKSIDVPDDFIMKCGEHAEERGITLEEYIAEAFTMIEEQRNWSYDANGSPVEDWDEERSNRRMDIIGQNGNDGLHYDKDNG